MANLETMFAARNSNRSLFLLAAGLCLLAGVLAQVTVRLGFIEAIAIICALISSALIVARPFVGVVLLVFLAQQLGLVMEVLGSPGQYVYEGLSALTLLAVILTGPLRRRETRWGEDCIAIRWAILFALCATLSTMFSDFPAESREALLKIFNLLVVFFLIIVTTNTKRRIMTLVIAVILATGISGAISALGYINGGPLITNDNTTRLAGASSTDATTTANVMLIGTMLGLYLMFHSPKLRTLGTFAAIFGAAGIVLSFSRSAMMFLIAGSSVVAFMLRKSRHAPAYFALGILVAISSLPAVPDRVWDRFSYFANPSEDWTLGRRWGYHVIGFDLLLENPVLGVGPGAFSPHYADFEFRWTEGRRQVTRQLHNLYLGTASQNGLVGLFAFLGLIGSILLNLYRTRERTHDPTLLLVANGMLLALGVFLTAVVTLPAMSNKMLWVVLGMGAAAGNVGTRSLPETQQGASPSKQTPAVRPST